MNGHHGSHIQPAVPLYNGRRGMPYTPPLSQQFPHAYNPYHHNIPQHFHTQQPWYPPYQSMQNPMPRPYPYPPMMNPPYLGPHHPPNSMSPRPHIQHHAPPPPLPSPRPQQAMLSPPSLPRNLHTPPSILPHRPSPPPAPPPVSRHTPFYPPLPWYSVSNAEFPPRTPRRRRRRPASQSSTIPVELPPRIDTPTESIVSNDKTTSTLAKPAVASKLHPQLVLSASATPTTSQAPSEADSTQPTTPSSAVTPQAPPRSSSSSTSKTEVRSTAKKGAIVPVVPNIPSLSRTSRNKSTSITSELAKPSDTELASDPHASPTETIISAFQEEKAVGQESEQTSKAASPQIKAAPKSWADLVRTKTVSKSSNGNEADQINTTQTNGFIGPKTSLLSDVLASFRVGNDDVEPRIAFLKPRGLVNTGNMCYMNSVLQILVFCVPFYNFLDQVGKQAAHSFKSDTPLVDAMIMFMREFPIIDSAVSVEQLRMRLRDHELEEYGDAFTPEFVYEVIRRLPRFSSMRRGHQQDAEEFLGFLLEELHEECTRILKASKSRTPSFSEASDDMKSPNSDKGHSEDNGWLEVGPRQRAAITRSSGTITTESPITKIFGGKLRSELRIPGAKNSVTLEPYQPLQLDIGSPQINNIIDALKGLTRSETLHGDFSSPRGPGVAATKQVFIETLPPVLILHLKRFQYDNTGGTQKIWKKIGYPLELELPKEIFPQHKRGAYAAHGGLPKYRLIGVVYHHGKNASGGHYTVDVRRQDGREWIRLDDTVIRRVRSEDVAEGGSEEDPKVLAAALEQHKKDQNANSNIFDQVREEGEENEQSESGWSQVNGTATSNPLAAGKKWSGVLNGTATPDTSSSGKRTPVGRFSVKDNKVAYLLFYRKIGI